MLYKKPLPTAGALAFAGPTSGGHFLKWLLVLSLGSSTVRVWPAPSLQEALSGSGTLPFLLGKWSGQGDRHYQSPVRAELLLGTLGHLLSDLWLVCNFPNRRKMQQWPQNSL